MSSLGEPRGMNSGAQASWWCGSPLWQETKKKNTFSSVYKVHDDTGLQVSVTIFYILNLHSSLSDIRSQLNVIVQLKPSYMLQEIYSY